MYSFDLKETSVVEFCFSLDSDKFYLRIMMRMDSHGVVFCYALCSQGKFWKVWNLKFPSSDNPETMIFLGPAEKPYALKWY